MKTKFEISIIVAVGLLAATTLYFISTDIDNQVVNTFKYESVEYDDLVSRNARLGLYAVPENYEKQTCFSISKDNIVAYPLDFLVDHIEDTSRIREDVEFSDTPPEFYTRFDTDIKTSLALEMIKAYDFDAVRIPTDNNVGKIPDTAYHFDCLFEYEDEQMMVRIMFESHFWENMPAYVNTTRNDVGLPTLTNDNIRVFDGGINSTVIFHNNLNREITLRSTDPINYQRNEDGRYYNLQEPERLFENKFSKITNDEKITIPPGKSFSYHFSSWNTPYGIPLNYTITPTNLKGTVTVMPYYNCAPSQDIFIPYAKIHKVPEHPSYLPAGYKYECGFYHYPEAATYYYANSTQSEEFKGKLGHGVNPKFFASGGLAIRLADVKSYGHPHAEKEPDKFTRLAERHYSEWMTTYVKGQPAVLEKTNYGENKFGRINIYLDHDMWYIVEGRMSFSELYRIAESIPFEKGDGPSSSIPESFVNPFQDRSLIMETFDLKEVYQPGQPISFEISTEGHLPDVGHLDVTITDSAGNIVWHNPQSVDVGDAEIGYVDYTWTTEYDFEAPKIHDVGVYTMTVSWNDVMMQHKFQVREETQFSLLEDMIPEHAHNKENFLSSFRDDCSRQDANQELVATDIGSDEIKNNMKQNNKLLDLIFEKQEITINDENRSREYIVPSQVIECIQNIKNDNINLAEKIEQANEKPETDMQMLLRESEILYHGHEYQRAIETADFILENLDDTTPEAMLVKGKSLSRLGESERALEVFEEVTETNPEFVEGWFRVGRALSSMDQYDMAMQSFDQAIKIDPKYVDAYIGKAFTLMILERYDEALEYAEKAVQIRPDILVHRDIYQTILDVAESR